MTGCFCIPGQRQSWARLSITAIPATTFPMFTLRLRSQASIITTPIPRIIITTITIITHTITKIRTTTIMMMMAILAKPATGTSQYRHGYFNYRTRYWYSRCALSGLRSTIWSNFKQSIVLPLLPELRR